MKKPDDENLIYNWNTLDDMAIPERKNVEFDDETLRDGLQAPGVSNPTIKQKIELLHLMESLGIEAVDLGLPGAGWHYYEDVLLLAREIANNKMKIKPNAAVRTHESDISSLVTISQKVGIPIEAAMYIGSSPIRQYVEGWDLKVLTRMTHDAVSFAVKNNLPVMFVTEDTMRSHPATLAQLNLTAIECGARRICLCDTVGHANTFGVTNLIEYIREIIGQSEEKIYIDWHGHNDRGLAVANALAAVLAGVDRLHASALGIGERAGNLPIEVIMANFKIMGWRDQDLRRLNEYCTKTSEYTGVPIPPDHPVVGQDVFATATGVHAAAIIKAQEKGRDWLADRIYSGVPASVFGRHQEILVGPMSGHSNVIYWLKTHKIEPKPELVDLIFDKAKNSLRVLYTEEIMELINAWHDSHPGE